MENLMKEKINNFIEYNNQIQNIITKYSDEKTINDEEEKAISNLLNQNEPIFGMSAAYALKNDLNKLKFDKVNYQVSFSTYSSLLQKVSKFQFPTVDAINASIDQKMMDKLAINEDEMIEKIHVLREKSMIDFRRLEPKYQQSMTSVKNILRSISLKQTTSNNKSMEKASDFFVILTVLFLLMGTFGFIGSFMVGIIGVILFIISLIFTICLKCAIKAPANVDISGDLQNIDKQLIDLKKTYHNKFMENYFEYDTLLTEYFNAKIERIKNELTQKGKELTEEKETALEKVSKKYYSGVHLTMDQQELYYSLEYPERKEFVKLGVLTSSDGDLIDVYQKCLDIAIKRKTLQEQRKQTNILNETKMNELEHQKRTEIQNEELKRLQEAQLYAQEEAVRATNMQTSQLYRQNELAEQQNKALKQQNKLAKKGNKELKKQTDIMRRNIGS